MAIIEICELTYRGYPSGEPILKNINLSLGQGQFLGIMGPSGSGKSSLCLALKGILTHYHHNRITGRIQLAGQEIKQYSPAQLALKVGMIFQDPDTQLFSSTVEDELAFAPENLCLSVDEIEIRVKKALQLVGMEKYRYHSPHQLSGGEKQLIALAAVLTLDPDILIFDEATAQLDPKEQIRVEKIIRNLHRKGKTVIVVDHNLNTLMQADKLLILNQGEIVKVGTPKEVLLDLNLLEEYGLQQPLFPLLWRMLGIDSPPLDHEEGYLLLERMVNNGYPTT